MIPYRDFVIFCSDQSAIRRTGSCTHKGLDTLGTLDLQRPEHRTQANLGYL